MSPRNLLLSVAMGMWAHQTMQPASHIERFTRTLKVFFSWKDASLPYLIGDRSWWHLQTVVLYSRSYMTRCAIKELTREWTTGTCYFLAFHVVLQECATKCRAWLWYLNIGGEVRRHMSTCMWIIAVRRGGSIDGRIGSTWMWLKYNHQGRKSHPETHGRSRSTIQLGPDPPNNDQIALGTGGTPWSRHSIGFFVHPV